MKKSIIVLLIAVLAVASAFAAPEVKVSGTAKAEYVFDFDAKTAKYGLGVDELKFTWTPAKKAAENFKGTGSKSGTEYPYVVVGLSLDGLALATSKGEETSSKLGGTNIDKFDIVGEDWTLSLVSKFAYKAHAYALNQITYDDGKGNDLTADVYFNWGYLAGKKDPKAITFKKDGHEVSVMAEQPKENETEVAVVFNSKNFSYEEFAGNFSAGLAYNKTSGTDAVVKPYVGFELNHVGEKGSSSLKADLAAYKNVEDKLKFRGAIALHGEQGIVSADVFYAKDDHSAHAHTTGTDMGLVYNSKKKDANEKAIGLSYAGLNTSEYGYIEAKAVVDASAKKIETIFTVTGKDLLHKAGSFDVSAKTTLLKGYNLTVAIEEIKKPAEKVTAHGHVILSPVEATHGITWSLDVDNITGKVDAIVTTANVTYTNETVKVAADAKVKGTEFKDGTYSLGITETQTNYIATAKVIVNEIDATTKEVARRVGLNLGIESTKVVDGATVYANYASKNLYKAYKPAGFGYGTFTTGIKVTF